MAYTEHYFTKFYNQCFYHVYNRCIDRKQLFAKAENYRYFLRQYQKYISPVAETHAYCLLGNHFHFLIRVNLNAPAIPPVPALSRTHAHAPDPACALDLSTFKKLTNLTPPTPLTPHTTAPVNTPAPIPIFGQPGEMDVHQVVSHQFRKLFQSYAMAFNKQQNRVGTLFQTPFKRAYIDSEIYLDQLIAYIHTNPEKHGLTEDFRKWPWSSYKELQKKTPINLIDKNFYKYRFPDMNVFENLHRTACDMDLQENIEE